MINNLAIFFRQTRISVHFYFVFRFEYKKFATAVNDVARCIEERIQQWSEYENSLERLLAWLTDAETSLKNYCLKNTLEEKQEQLEKYQVSSK